MCNLQEESSRRTSFVEYYHVFQKSDALSALLGVDVAIPSMFSSFHESLQMNSVDSSKNMTSKQETTPRQHTRGGDGTNIFLDRPVQQYLLDTVNYCVRLIPSKFIWVFCKKWDTKSLHDRVPFHPDGALIGSDFDCPPQPPTSMYGDSKYIYIYLQ